MLYPSAIEALQINQPRNVMLEKDIRVMNGTTKPINNNKNNNGQCMIAPIQ